MSASEQQSEIESSEARRLASAVRRIDTAMKEFSVSGWNRHALVVLLHDSTQVSKRDIAAVLSGLESLKERYLEKTNDDEATR